jgi:hypothetical protein
MKVLHCQPPAKCDQRAASFVVIERLVRGCTASDRGYKLERRLKKQWQKGDRMID